MTNGFSISEAMAAPVRVIRRHPLSVFVWGLLPLSFSLAGMALIFSTLADMPLTPGEEPPPAVFADMMAMQGASMLLNVGQLALAVITWAAVLRGTFMIGRPERSFFLRAGLDELRLTVVGLALVVGAYVAVIVAVLIGAALVAVVWQMQETAAVILGAVLTLALILAVAVAMARVSLIAPATLALKRFAFVEGWRLGQGQTMRLLGLLICTWLIYMVVYLLTAFVVIVALFASGAVAHLQAAGAPATFGDIIPSPEMLVPLAAVILVPGSFLYGAVMTLLCAPFASAFRQLADSAPVSAVGAAGDATDPML